MQRFGTVIHVKPGCSEEYKRYHATVWPEVLSKISECNIRNYSVFIKENVLFGYFEYHGTDIKKGKDGCRPKDPGMVGDRGSFAGPSPIEKRGGMVGGNGRSISSRLKCCFYTNSDLRPPGHVIVSGIVTR
jgi:L-rhamnose mutarotase